MERRIFSGFLSVVPADLHSIRLKEERPLIVPGSPDLTARLELDGRAPIPVLFHPRAWLRGDGSLIVEGQASAEEDWTLMIGARGRVRMAEPGPRFGVKIAATDPDSGLVRFLVQPRIIR